MYTCLSWRMLSTASVCVSVFVCVCLSVSLFLCVYLCGICISVVHAYAACVRGTFVWTCLDWRMISTASHSLSVCMSICLSCICMCCTCMCACVCCAHVCVYVEYATAGRLCLPLPFSAFFLWNRVSPWIYSLLGFDSTAWPASPSDLPPVLGFLSHVAIPRFLYEC